MLGGTQRLRVSSQSLKRSWRDSEVFERGVGVENKGARTLKVAQKRVYDPLIAAEVSEEKALAAAQTVRQAFESKPKGKDDETPAADEPKAKGKAAKKVDPVKELATSQLIFVSPRQLQLIESYVARVTKGEKLDDAQVKTELLTNDGLGADVALFGRMMSANAQFTVEAAAQVAHAITVHKVTVEDDYFSAVDDLNSGADDAGAGHIGTNEFAAGLYYLYFVIDRTLLEKSLKGDKELAAKAIRAVVESACTVSPTGKKATFGSFARASFALAEKGSQQPRGLSTAFIKSVTGDDFVDVAITRLGAARASMETVYGKCADEVVEFNAHEGTGSLSALLDFVAK